MIGTATALLLLISICSTSSSSHPIDDNVNSLKRFAVVCGSAVLEGILKLSPRTDASWDRCRRQSVPIECESSCAGYSVSRRLDKNRERACWLCERWRVLFHGQETPWLWAPLLISACETLGFGTSQSFVDMFTSDESLYRLALASTLPDLFVRPGDGGGGGGAGVEMWCDGERFLWMGGGGGGGSSNSSRGRGGGAGVQTRFGWSLGAGMGGGIKAKYFHQDTSDEIHKQSFTFGYEKDKLGEGVREGTAQDVHALKEYIHECYVNNSLAVFGGGGSGGDDLMGAAVRFNMTSCDFRYVGT